MNKEFIPYEQSLALKELGFDEPCLAYYDAEKVFKFPGTTMCNRNFLDLLTVTAPLYQQAFRWMREKHGIYSSIFFEDDTKYYYQFNDIDGIVTLNTGHKTYEEAEQACLDKLIVICKAKTRQ